MDHRILHLRDPLGFSEEDGARFAAGCRLFQSYVLTCLRELRALGEPLAADDAYQFDAPSRSDDGTVLSLRINGCPTLGSRAEFETVSCHLLSHFFSQERRRGMEEGITESSGGKVITAWRAISAFTLNWVPDSLRQASSWQWQATTCLWQGCSSPVHPGAVFCDEHL